MGHLSNSLPDRIERGAVRREEWGTEIIRTDGGAEVRNNRWAAPLRSYDVSMPLMERDDEDYIDLRALYAEAEGSLHTFDFLDWSDDETVVVRFDGPLQLTGHSPHLDYLSFTLVEVR